MLFKDIAILDENLDYQPNKYVGVIYDRIEYIGDTVPDDDDIKKYGEIYDGMDRLLIPAFYNAHAHAPMTLLRGYAENLPLQEWLNDSVWPFEAKMTAEDNYWATLLAVAEMARYGVVSFSDMYYHTPERVQAVIESGLKANICESELYFEEKPFSDYKISSAYEEFVDKYHGAANGRILIDYNIHAEYTSNPRTVKDIAEVTKEKGLRMHLHASETKNEHEECKQRHNGLTPIQYFESLGVLDSPTTAAHCVWCEPEDLEILKRHGVFVAANPASNMKLGSGFAPIPEMLAKGLNVCLGTDGMASNNSHDMMSDMYLLAMIYKGYGLDPAVVTPKQAFNAATKMGALSQGREDCGLIKEGMKADLAVLDTSGPSWTPMTDPLVNLVYSASGSDVVLTMSDGEIVYRNGEYPTIDLEKATSEVASRAKRIISELRE
ncbi:MAG: amidohydrolase [Eggerthellaceae bacterium]|nr:amidohydrolase [Eggerthellaceae bacterium]